MTRGQGPVPRIRTLGSGVWVVNQPAKRGRRVSVQSLGQDTWVVRRGRGRVVRKVGPPRIRTHLVMDEAIARRRMRIFERSVLHYMADEHIAFVLRRLDINCVLDVGANLGQYAKKLRKNGYTGRIVSFEPLPHLAEKLEKAAARDVDWQVIRCALGDVSAETEMEIAGGQGRMSSLRAPSEFGKSWSSKLGSEGSAPVAVRRLDELFDDVLEGIEEPRVYLKLDTQGYDLQAFAGAGERINDVVAMQSEVSSVPIYEGVPRLTDQIAAYEAAGFELTGMFPVITDPATMRVIEFDAVMVRPGQVEEARKRRRARRLRERMS